MRSTPLLLSSLAFAAFLALSGCTAATHMFRSSEGPLTLQSVASKGVQLRGNFATALYCYDDPNHVTIVLVEGPVDNPTQALTIRMFWEPVAAGIAGGTPIDPNATNATIHHLVFTGAGNAQLGIYSGAGYVYPSNTPGRDTLKAAVWQANLLLTDRSAAFQDLLGQATMQGGFQAQRDDLGAEQLVRRLDALAAKKLGYPRLVEARDAGRTAGAF